MFIEGYWRVSEGGYGFFWDFMVNVFKMNRECFLMIIGFDFVLWGYGIGFFLGVMYFDELFINIFWLGDSGFLD